MPVLHRYWCFLDPLPVKLIILTSLSQNPLFGVTPVKMTVKQSSVILDQRHLLTYNVSQPNSLWLFIFRGTYQRMCSVRWNHKSLKRQTWIQETASHRQEKTARSWEATGFWVPRATNSAWNISEDPESFHRKIDCKVLITLDLLGGYSDSCLCTWF